MLDFDVDLQDLLSIVAPKELGDYIRELEKRPRVHSAEEKPYLENDYASVDVLMMKKGKKPQIGHYDYELEQWRIRSPYTLEYYPDSWMYIPEE